MSTSDTETETDDEKKLRNYCKVKSSEIPFITSNLWQVVEVEGWRQELQERHLAVVAAELVAR